MGTTGSSLLAEVGAPEETGLRMGLSESAQSLAGVLTPAVAGYLYERYGNSAPGFGAATFCVLALALFTALVPPRLGASLGGSHGKAKAA